MAAFIVPRSVHDAVTVTTYRVWQTRSDKSRMRINDRATMAEAETLRDEMNRYGLQPGTRVGPLNDTVITGYEIETIQPPAPDAFRCADCGETNAALRRDCPQCARMLCGDCSYEVCGICAHAHETDPRTLSRRVIALSRAVLAIPFDPHSQTRAIVAHPHSTDLADMAQGVRLIVGRLSPATAHTASNPAALADIIEQRAEVTRPSGKRTWDAGWWSAARDAATVLLAEHTATLATLEAAATEARHEAAQVAAETAYANDVIAEGMSVAEADPAELWYFGSDGSHISAAEYEARMATEAAEPIALTHRDLAALATATMIAELPEYEDDATARRNAELCQDSPTRAFLPHLATVVTGDHPALVTTIRRAQAAYSAMFRADTDTAAAMWDAAQVAARRALDLLSSAVGPYGEPIALTMPTAVMVDNSTQARLWREIAAQCAPRAAHMRQIVLTPRQCDQLADLAASLTEAAAVIFDEHNTTIGYADLCAYADAIRAIMGEPIASPTAADMADALIASL